MLYISQFVASKASLPSGPNGRFFRISGDMSTLMLSVVLNKWKNHFYEMKGDVGMSVHEKERKQEDAYTKTQTHS